MVMTEKGDVEIQQPLFVVQKERDKAQARSWNMGSIFL